MSLSDSTCDCCADLRQNVPIGNVRQLQQVHRVVFANIVDGTIRRVDSPSKAVRATQVKNLFGVDHDPDPPMPTFEHLLNQSDLPDVVLYYFRCSACHLLFEFHANSYHGSGGEWRPIFDEDLV